MEKYFIFIHCIKYIIAIIIITAVVLVITIYVSHFWDQLFILYDLKKWL